MNKRELKKNIGHRVRIRPMAKRFTSAQNGLELQLPPVDDDWSIQEWSDKSGIRISNIMTGHSVPLGFDHIREFMTDPARSDGGGLLILNVRVHIGGAHSPWTEPIRLGESATDQFDNVHGWTRENDAAYIQSLFPNTPAATVTPQAGKGNSTLSFVSLAYICLGVGLLIANT